MPSGLDAGELARSGGAFVASCGEWPRWSGDEDDAGEWDCRAGAARSRSRATWFTVPRAVRATSRTGSPRAAGDVGTGQFRGVRDEEAAGALDQEAIAERARARRRDARMASSEWSRRPSGRPPPGSGGKAARRIGRQTPVGGRADGGLPEAVGVERIGAQPVSAGLKGTSRRPRAEACRRRATADGCFPHPGVGPRDEEAWDGAPARVI